MSFEELKLFMTYNIDGELKQLLENLIDSYEKIGLTIDETTEKLIEVINNKMIQYS